MRGQRRMIPRALLLWLALLAGAFANGAFREILLVPRLGTARAHVASTAILAAIVLLLAYGGTRWVAPAGARQALAIGAMWVALTLAFEVLAGHYLFHRPWSVLLEDYDLTRGRVWIVIPLVTLLAPWLAWRLRS